MVDIDETREEVEDRINTLKEDKEYVVQVKDTPKGYHVSLSPSDMGDGDKEDVHEFADELEEVEGVTEVDTSNVTAAGIIIVLDLD
jgi:hypothetical protein